MSMVNLEQGRTLFQAANFPKAYHIRGDLVVTVFGSTQHILRTCDAVDATALAWAINNMRELIEECEELRGKNETY